MIRLTQTGKLFLGVSVILYLASLTSQSGLLLLVIGLLLGCYLINLITAWRAVHHLEIHPPRSVQVREGARLNQPWHVVNRSSHQASLLELRSGRDVLFRLAVLEAHGEKHILPEMIFARRGVYVHADIRLVSAGPFGFVTVARKLDLPGEVVVYPALYEVPEPRAAGYDLMVGGKFKGRRRTTSGTHFAGVRPWNVGDPLRQIHWASSSKGQGLMVKTFEEELSGRVAIIVDAGEATDRELLDDCVRAAGSLIFAALDAGHHVEWIDLARLEAQLVPPFADGHEILESLARLEPRPGGLTEARLRAALEGVSSRSAVCLVLTEFNAAARTITNDLLARRRTVSVYLPEKSAGPGDCGGATLCVYRRHEIVEMA